MKKRVAIPLALVAGVIAINAGGGSDETPVAKPAAAEAPAADAAAPADKAAADKAAADKAAAEKAAADKAAADKAAAEKAAAEKAVVVTSAQDMISLLESNALNAKNTYKDKRVTVTVFVGSIDASGDYFSLDPEPDALVFTGVQVYTDEEFLDQVASFTEGQAVTVTGTVNDVGELMGYSVEAETIQ